MGTHTPIIDETYRRYADLLLRQHRLLSEGKDEDRETEAVEEEMARLWDRLDVVQRRSLSGLGSDLNWVRRKFELAPRSRRREEVSPEDCQAFDQAWAGADWHGVLHQARLCAPAMSPSQLASVRAAAWDHLGFPQLAGVFSDVASAMGSGNSSIANRS